MVKTFDDVYEIPEGDEEMTCIWFDSKKGYGMFEGCKTQIKILVHRKSLEIGRIEKKRVKKGFILKKQEWEVI